MRPRFTVWFDGLNSPETYSMFVQALCLLFGTVLFWVLCAIILSILGGPLIILLTIALIAVFIFKSRQKEQRERWANEGRCSQCGYDLRETPDRCPECGRETALDEPAWRKMRRGRAKLNQPGGVMPLPEQNRQRLLSLPTPAVPEKGTDQ